MIWICLATSILESRDQHLPTAEMIRVRWAVTSSGDRADGAEDADAGSIADASGGVDSALEDLAQVGSVLADVAGLAPVLGRGALGLSLAPADLVDLVDMALKASALGRLGLVSGLVSGRALALDHCLERHSGAWRDDLVLAPAASAPVVLVAALDSGRVCLAAVTSNMSCSTSCRSGQSMDMR